MTPLLFEYDFDITTIATPPSRTVTLDVGFPYTAATELRCNRSTDASINVKRLLLALEIGTMLWLQAANDDAVAHAFAQIGAPIDRDTAVAFPVRWVSSDGRAFTHQENLLVAAVPPAAAVVPPAGPVPPFTFAQVPIGVPLVSLAAAKAHLYVSDSDHDTDVTQKLAAAQAQIVARLSWAADPAWTEATVPRHIQSAILLLLGALYEVRGGEDRDENFRKTDAAIEALLSRNRDPTLA